MTIQLKNRSFVKEIDFAPGELRHLLDLAADLKRAKREGVEQPLLRGRNIALVFEKTSTRTRCAFEVGAYDQGAHVTYLDPSGSQMGHKESAADTARVLGRMYDAIEYRGSAHAVVEELAAHAGVPVYNGLTDDWHPTQMLADFLTMREATGKADQEISYAYVGDGRNNMGNSLLVMGALMGSDVRIGAPEGLQPSGSVQAVAAEIAEGTGARLTVTADPRAAVAGVDVVHTDVWVSMGEATSVWEERVSLLRPYQVNSELLAAVGNDVSVMHCLPALHNAETTVGRQIAEHTGVTGGLEITDEVFESNRCIAFDQAENRLHTIKAVMVATLV